MNFQESVRYLLSLGRELAAPTQAAAAKFNLENITTLAKALGHPEKKYSCVHIAGTNGKGSTAVFLESILRAEGYRTGLYTSPHLEKINERIKVNGESISDDAFADVFSRMLPVIEELLADGTLRAHPTFFECITAIAFLYFAESAVQVAVLETGLGGRLDATNIVTPRVSVITRIDYDHENFLGHSLREIAIEKAGIIKPDVPVVIATQHQQARMVLLHRANELHAPVAETDNMFTIEAEKMLNGCVRASVKENASEKILQVAPRLHGRFQLQNALNAAATALVLSENGTPLSDQSIEQGIASATWPGRIEKVQSNPDVYLDGAHNPSAARELATYLKENLDGRKIIFVFGALRDKAVDEIAGTLFPLAGEVIFTQPNTSRAISAMQLAEIAGYHAVSQTIIPNAREALRLALSHAKPDDVICITGSLYLVGELRGRWGSPFEESKGSTQ
jgi:dihydrofolate synthase/folylpolyglutamate synthase